LISAGKRGLHEKGNCHHDSAVCYHTRLQPQKDGVPLRAARLDEETFRELRDDSSASAQSVLVVAIIGLCYGAGLGFFGFFIAGISPIEILAITLIGLTAAVVVAFIWSGTTFLIVTKIFRGKVT
jgi:F0F1-type ATP synthase assembly protein I